MIIAFAVAGSICVLGLLVLGFLRYKKYKESKNDLLVQESLMRKLKVSKSREGLNNNNNNAKQSVASVPSEDDGFLRSVGVHGGGGGHHVRTSSTPETVEPLMKFLPNQHHHHNNLNENTPPVHQDYQYQQQQLYYQQQPQQPQPQFYQIPTTNATVMYSHPLPPISAAAAAADPLQLAASASAASAATSYNYYQQQQQNPTRPTSTDSVNSIQGFAYTVPQMQPPVVAQNQEIHPQEYFGTLGNLPGNSPVSYPGFYDENGQYHYYNQISMMKPSNGSAGAEEVRK
jgi:hypothetical protein